MTPENIFGKAVRNPEYDRLMASREELGLPEKARSLFMSMTVNERKVFTAMVNLIIMPNGGSLTYVERAS